MDNLIKNEPLASKMRPETLEDIVGQDHILGKNKLLYRAIKADKISSIIFYGPPGTGKTSIAKVISNTTSAKFMQLNATIAGKKDMEEVIKDAKDRISIYGQKTLLFIDEIHRFNKSQQDFLLPYVEDGTVILIGATTENPYFEVNKALLSRSLVFELKPLSIKDIRTLLESAVYDEKRGLGLPNVNVCDDAFDFLADLSDGDARKALNALELSALTTDRDETGKINITKEVVSECIQKRIVKYDKDGDNHYNIVSAFIKSMRGSDPDAAVYYLAKMIYAGEDLKFIARRIMICASEDVGNADPMALVVAVNAAQAAERIGMPEARIVLSQAAIYVACAPKSNASYKAIDFALKNVETTKTSIPAHLRDAHYNDSSKLGSGIGYKYPHEYDHNYIAQQYLPDEIINEKFCILSDNGKEKEIKKYLKEIKKEA